MKILSSPIQSFFSFLNPLFTQTPSLEEFYLRVINLFSPPNNIKLQNNTMGFGKLLK